jgi:hypothetical protein
VCPAVVFKEHDSNSRSWPLHLMFPYRNNRRTKATYLMLFSFVRNCKPFLKKILTLFSYFPPIANLCERAHYWQLAIVVLCFIHSTVE